MPLTKQSVANTLQHSSAHNSTEHHIFDIFSSYQDFLLQFAQFTCTITATQHISAALGLSHNLPLPSVKLLHSWPQQIQFLTLHFIIYILSYSVIPFNPISLPKSLPLQALLVFWYTYPSSSPLFNLWLTTFPPIDAACFMLSHHAAS